MTSEQLARSLLPPNSAGTCRSQGRPVPTVDLVDRVLLTAAALATVLALWLLWAACMWGL